MAVTLCHPAQKHRQQRLSFWYGHADQNAAQDDLCAGQGPCAGEWRPSLRLRAGQPLVVVGGHGVSQVGRVNSWQRSSNPDACTGLKLFPASYFEIAWNRSGQRGAQLASSLRSMHVCGHARKISCSSGAVQAPRVLDRLHGDLPPRHSQRVARGRPVGGANRCLRHGHAPG